MYDASAGNLSSQISQALRGRVVAQHLWEQQHQRVLAEAIPALHRAGCQPLLFKGTALALSVYPQAAHRARGDTDVLVAEQTYDNAREVLCRLGFVRGLTAARDTMSAETDLCLHDATGLAHHIDLHARLNNSPWLARLFSHSELLARSLPVEGHDAAFRRVSNVDSLLIASLHRLVHSYAPYWAGGVPHLDPDRLIWFEDIRHLLRRLSRSEWTSLVELARRKQLIWVTSDTLARAAPAVCREFLVEVADGQSVEPGRELAQRYFTGTDFTRFRMDLAALPGTRLKVRYVLELLLPPSRYMQAKYHTKNRFLLPYLYARRAIGGIVGRLKQGRT